MAQALLCVIMACAEGGGRMYSMGERGYKVSRKEQFAHTVYTLHSRASGEYRRLRILHVLSSSTIPLSVNDIVRRTRLPRRTVYYYLRQLLLRGYVERRGRARSPGVVYVVTRSGRRFLHRSMCANTRRLDRRVVLEGGGRGRVGVWFVVRDNELGVRTGFGWVRRVLAGFGVRVGRLGFHHVYSRRGVVHFDSRHSWGVVGSGVELGLWGDRNGILAILVLVLAFVRAMGFKRRFVLELWDSLPDLVFVDGPGGV